MVRRSSTKLWQCGKANSLLESQGKEADLVIDVHDEDVVHTGMRCVLV